MSDKELVQQLAEIKTKLDEMSRPKNGNGVFAEKLRMNITSVATLLVFFVAGVWAIGQRLNTIELSITSATSDRWSRTHMREYNHQLHDHNPTVTVPDIDTITKKVTQD